MTSRLKETKFVREGIMLDKWVRFGSSIVLGGDRLNRVPRFFKMLSSDETRAWYGPDHVLLAADRGAIETLLISDKLFRYVKVSRSPGHLSYPQAQGK